jgi:hypothetical protein
MRLFSNFLAALSLLLLLVVCFFWTRSYFRYEGVLHFSEGAPLQATASGVGETLDADVTGRSSGWISYRGRLTYVSIANPLRTKPWESWSQPADAPPSAGPMILVWEARAHSGLAGGSAKTQNELRDPVRPEVSWKLPYRFFTLPYWLPAMLLVLLPYRWLAGRRLAARLAREGRCVHCAHDVRGVTTGTCPQCGAAIK